jgi:tetratricopeptide (TPR) repeat protein
MTITNKTLAACAALICLPALSQVDANYCGSLSNAYGPFDYRADHYIQRPGDQSPHEEKRHLVEGAHFTPRVENLIGAQSAHQIGPPGADLDYTLRAFPNHHRALLAVMRYGEKFNTQQPPGLPRIVECYFERAIRFQPNDTVARSLYATFLFKSKREPEAQAQLKQAVYFAGDNAFSNYNIGLVYFDMKLYDQALAQAHKAMALGFERTQLKDLLEKAGQWKEPPPAAAEAPAPAAADVSASPQPSN